ncbi:MAG: circadian clock KaiB family protein [Xenococcaceae cyanobacterium MO_167.B52]|nr:circadian clock KaiB family protein [Xenococcaceae cyanobacterium MO_167.B52]
MTQRQSSLPQIFKGIALFTPGGDMVYTIDPNKQDRWHLHLCLCLQEVLGLPEPPHFLIPAYTATVDRWLNSRTGKVEVSAELYPAVKPYLPLLQVLFDIQTPWQIASWQEEHCNPAVLETYRPQFSALWEENDLIIKLDPQNPRVKIAHPINFQSTLQLVPSQSNSYQDGYILRLFISGDSLKIEKTLDTIHQALEQGLVSPYTLKIIDITKNPEQAEIHHISATPTLVRIFPEPVKRIVGNLDNPEKVLQVISS